MRVTRMAEPLVAYIKQDRPFLGICLGLQLLFERSEEGDCGIISLFSNPRFWFEP